MTKIPLGIAVAVALALGTAGTASAQGKSKFDIGKKEYEAKCVVCHGSTGKGDGSYADLLKRQATDLTLLKKNNGGVFPFDRVYGVIDGRDAIKGHGDRDMPVWGKDYLSEKTQAAEHYADVPYDMESYTRARILSLIDYLNRLQAK